MTEDAKISLRFNLHEILLYQKFLGVAERGFHQNLKQVKHTINRIKRLHLLSYYPRPCSGVALIRRILPHAAILHMQLDILRELDTNGFKCIDSDMQERKHPLVPLPPNRFPPTPLAINKWSLNFRIFRSGDSERKFKGSSKKSFEYFDSWVVSLKKINFICMLRKGAHW